MHIDVIPNRNSPPAILLRESYREDGKVKKRTLANTSNWDPEVIAGFEQQIPAGAFGQPEDLGPLAVYLASDASRYMTGASLVIDGGYTLW